MQQFRSWLLLILGHAFLVLSPLAVAADCSNAKSSADYAYSYVRRGYNASNLDELHYYARKAKSEAEDTQSYANSCGCSNAASAADDVYTYARRAYNSDDFSDAQSYMRRAKSAADDALSYLSSCD